MDDHLKNEVSLGHLGKATYVEDLQEWKFLRAPNKGLNFNLAGEANVFSHGKSLNLCQEPRNGNSVTKRTEQVLLNLHPELTHGLSNMVLEEATSRAITSAATSFEPSGHGCLAFGDVARMIDERIANQTIPIMVCLSGNSSSSLTLFPYDFSQASLATGNETSLDENQSMLWTVPGGPVQQVSSSEAMNEQRKNFAARLSFSTTIFSPIYHRIPVPVSLNDKDSYAESYLLAKIDPNPLVNIPCNLTGGQPHASVVFNPWYQRQLALIDRAGNWSIWDLQRRHKRKAGWFAERGPSGSLRLLEADESLKPIDHYDGWHAISWVGTIHQLLVCDRRNVSLCRIDVRPPKQEPLDLCLEFSSEWILDVLWSQKSPSHIFVLTTLRIFWLNIAPPEVSRLSQSDDFQTATILLTWKHFRDPEDISLKLTSISVGDDFFIVLYSRLNLLVMTFQAFSSSDEPSHPVSISDARIIPLPRPPIEQPTHRTMQSHNTVSYSSITFKEIDLFHSSKEDNSGSDFPKSVAFMGQLVDGRLVECVYLVTTHGEETLGDCIPTSHGRKKKLAKDHTKLINESEFIVEDGDKSLLVSACRQNHLNQHKGPFGAIIPTYEAREQWQHQYSLAISALKARKSLKLGGSGNLVPFGDWLKALPELFPSLLLTPTPCSTSRLMVEAVKLSFSIDELENMAQELDRFIQIFAEPGDLVIPEFQINLLPLPCSPSSDFSMTQPGIRKSFSLMELYDTMICHWLAPLPDGIPNRLRASKENIIRSIISELCLASIAIFRCKRENTGDAQQFDNNSPIKPESYSVSEFKEQLTQWSQRDILSSPMRAESSVGSQLDTRPRASLDCLQRYTTVSRQKPISRKTAITASHWACGSDPNLYDWQATISSRSNPQSENESNSKSRKRKGKRPLSSAGQSQRSFSTDIPIARPWGSQPETSALNPNIGSSQVTEGGFTMTQVEQGIFGKRKTPFKDKKKKRVAGF
ncbi:hypothetical protein FQN49_004149 [Arthroderma sp. PD_2]|nr:hypothetical protein FQN49_004149 [Arthroderma sp. PD_2]